MYRGLRKPEIYGALAVGVLGGVYIFGPAAKEAGDSLKAKEAGVSPVQQQPAPVIPPKEENKKSWRD